MKAHGIILPLLLLGFAGGALASPHGGTGGQTFTASCGANAVLVGAVGGADTQVNRIMPMCVRVKSDGTWDGATFITGTYGSGGRYYQVACASGDAVRGIDGVSGNVLNQLKFLCGKLGVADGKIKIVGNGVPTELTAFGGTQGGTSFSDPCPTGEIVLGLPGRAGTVIDQIDRSCGTLTPPPAAPFTASLQVSPSSSASNLIECNTQVGLGVTAAGGTGAGAIEYRVAAFRLYYTGAEAGEEIQVTNNWVSSGSLGWTPPSAGVYQVRAKARRGGVESTVAEARVYVRLGLSTTANPASPRPSPGTVGLTATASCAPSNTTLFYQFLADTTSSTMLTAGSWTTPSLAPGPHSLKSKVMAIRNATYDASKQLATSDAKEMFYQVQGGEVFTTYFNTKHKHEKCVTCHTMTDAPSASGSLGAIKRKWHIDTGKFAASTPMNVVSSCSGCHNSGTGHAVGWRAAEASQRWTETTPDATICSTINNAPITNTNSTMHHHLTTDPRIVWALGKMGVSTTEWNTHATAWTNNNRACP